MAAKKPNTSVTLIIGDKRYTANGKDILTALQGLKEPKDVKSITRIETVVDGKQVNYFIRLNPTKLKRLFANGWEMELLAKKLETLR